MHKNLDLVSRFLKSPHRGRGIPPPTPSPLVSNTLLNNFHFQWRPFWVKSLHWHALWYDFTAPTQETVYEAARLTQIVKIVFKQAMAAILDYGK